MTLTASIIGFIIFLEGIAALVAPDTFAKIIATIQEPPLLYIAAVARIAIGVVLLRSAASSRLPRLLMGIGTTIVVGGLLTPFYGVRFSQVVIGLWSESVSIERAFAAAALVIGGIVLFATLGNRRAA
jgi:uncharacterized protein YjeT (DUF2065 family)